MMNDVEFFGKMDIFEAIQTGESSQVIDLINEGTNLNQETEHQETPLSIILLYSKLIMYPSTFKETS